MREAHELAESLRAATALVRDVVAGHISLDEFADRYGNFFYFEALDEHEAGDGDRILLEKHAITIALHEQVQHTVVDLLYRGHEGQKAAYLAAGRIDDAEAMARLTRLAELYRVS